MLKLENKLFENFSLLAEAVSEILKVYPGLFQRLSPAIRKFYTKRSLTITKDFIAYLNQEMRGDPFMASLNQVIAGLFERELAGIPYPAQELFDKAAQAKIHSALGACNSSILHNQYALELRLNDEDFLDLETDLLNN